MPGLRDRGRREWALALYRRSVIKQEKVRQIQWLLPETEGLDCLDIGGDNGVVSLLLRERGGRWKSADLDKTAVEAIRDVVGTGVYRIDGRTTPFEDSSFDLVVIVDFLEHIETDREFADELARILKPGGQLVVNVPHLKPHSLINRLRHAIGLTDERHGHVRPGYDLQSLSNTLGSRFELAQSRTYSRAFSELVDTLLNAAYILRERGRTSEESKKGTVVTQESLGQGQKGFRMLGMAYPLLRTIASLDRLLFLQAGYRLIARFTVT